MFQAGALSVDEAIILDCLKSSYTFESCGSGHGSVSGMARRAPVGAEPIGDFAKYNRWLDLTF